jgi:hypothetical protein
VKRPKFTCLTDPLAPSSSSCTNTTDLAALIETDPKSEMSTPASFIAAKNLLSIHMLFRQLQPIIFSGMFFWSIFYQLQLVERTKEYTKTIFVFILCNM